MRERTAFLFPGLGAYSTGVLRQAVHDFPRIQETLRDIDKATAGRGIPSVSDTLFGRRRFSIRDLLTERAELLQLAIFGTSVAAYRVLIDEGGKPDLLLGHSFGEIAALVAAGAFTTGDGARLVCARTTALKSWEGKGEMAAVEANEAVARHLTGVIDDRALVIACLNAPRQTVLAGPPELITRAERVAEALGLFFTRLNLPYASHHPDMRTAVDDFIALTRDIRQLPLRTPVYSPIHRRWYTDDDNLCQRIGECVVFPVRLTDTVRDLHSHGYLTFVECGALNALTRSVELTVPGVRTFTPLADANAESDGLRAAARSDVVTASAAESVSEQAKVVATAASAREPATTWTSGRQDAETPARAAGPNREQVIAELRDLYAEVLEYPHEVLTDDARFDADLGVDSLKQTALLTRLVRQFKLPDDPAELQVWDFPTLGHIADHVVATTAGRHA